MTKVSGLPAMVGDAPAGTLLPAVAGGVTQKATKEQIFPVVDSSELDVFTGPIAPDDKIVVRNKSNPTDDPVEGTDEEAEAATLGLRHNKDDATTDPGVGDDSADGFSVGSRWTNVTLDRVFYCADATAGAAVWIQMNTWKIIPCISDQVKTADTTLAADAVLQVPLLAGKTYRIRGSALFKLANADMDAKYDYNNTATLTGDIMTARRSISANNTTEIAGISDAALGSTAWFSTLAGIARLEFETVFTTTTTGTWSLRWAQNTSDAGALTRLKGSFLEYRVFD